MLNNFLYKIRSRLITALLIPLLPLVALMVIISVNTNHQQIERANESAQNFAFIASGYQKQLLTSLQQLLTVMAEDNNTKIAADCTRRLNRISVRLHDYSSIEITDASGIVVCGTAKTLGVDLSGTSYFQAAKQSLRFFLSDAIKDETLQAPVLVGALPWTNDNGDLAGMAIATISAERFGESFQEMPLPPGSKYFLLDRQQTLITGSGLFPESVAHLLPGLPVITQKPVPFLVTEDGQARTYTGVSIENGALTVLIGVPRRFFLNFSLSDFVAGTAGPLILLIIVVALVWFLGDRLVTAPVSSLIRAARAYSRGDLSVRPIVGSTGGELRELSTTFVEMADRISQREGQLQEAIARRELMLREIHHRVKNNLQIVISLINLQSKSVAAPEAMEAFTEIQTRMRALALVQRHLYEGGKDLDSVNIGAFLAELGSSLQAAYGMTTSPVAMEIHADDVYDIADRAIPLALFMTETISNALRHAFPDNRPGFIKIVLEGRENRYASFTIEDNGIGLEGAQQSIGASPPPSGVKRSSGLGMSLIKAFARQVDGELTVSGPPGTVIKLVFQTRECSPTQ